MKRILYTHILPAVCWLFVFASCIKEDQSDCPADLKIYLTYTPATYARTGVDPTEVDRLNLYVFDEQGIFQGVWIDENPILSPDYYMTIASLPPGPYTFIAWGGLRDSYTTTPTEFIIGKTTLSEAQLCLHPLTNEITEPIHPLFYAGKADRILANTRLQRINIPLIQAYNTINLTTEGLPETDDEFCLNITDNNGKYNFDHSFAPCSEFTYKTPCTQSAQKQPQATINILKLAADKHPQLEIYNTTRKEVLYKADLIELLNKIEGINYNEIHTFDIHIKFESDGTDLTASVSINGWQVTEDEEVLF